METMEPWIEELLENAYSEKMTAKQKRIFEAAVEIFSEKGYAATSTSEIAKRAGVAEGTIFRHYKTKKDLLLSIAAPAMVKILAPFVMREFRSAFREDTPTLAAFLEGVIENRIAFMEKNMSLLKVLIQELPFHPELQQAFRNVILPQVLAQFEKVLKSLQDKGQVRKDLPVTTIVRLAAFCDDRLRADPQHRGARRECRMGRRDGTAGHHRLHREGPRACRISPCWDNKNSNPFNRWKQCSVILQYIRAKMPERPNIKYFYTSKINFFLIRKFERYFQPGSLILDTSRR